jgi:hypothetical protein
MDKEFVPYAEALELKELGFDEPCFKVVEGGPIDIFPYKKLDVPLYQQAFRWFREKYKLYSHVRESISFDNTLEFVTQINGTYVNHGIFDKPVNRFETYEEAELECLKKLIEIAKETK